MYADGYCEKCGAPLGMVCPRCGGTGYCSAVEYDPDFPDDENDDPDVCDLCDGDGGFEDECPYCYVLPAE